MDTTKDIDYTNWSKEDLISLILMYQKVISHLQVIRNCDKNLLELKEEQNMRQEKLILNMEALLKLNEITKGVKNAKAD